MMRTIIALILGLASTAAMAEPQRQTFRDERSRGWPFGQRHQRQHHVLRSMGRNTGRSVTRGNITTVYDNIGRQTGNITTKPQGR